MQKQPSKALPIWRPDRSWEESEKEWEAQRDLAASKSPIKGLKTLPKMVGVTKKTARFLRLKALWYMLTRDSDRAILKGFLKHPFRYLRNYVRSLFRKEAFKRDGDFFLYNTVSTSEFETLISDPDTVLVVGFSYCHKPFECPSGRFTNQCQRAIEHPVCQQCYIGKVFHSLEGADFIPVAIPTVHAIGKVIFDVVEKYPNQQILFLITACEMTLRMFADWGNMVGIRGIGVRLDGRICNTMAAFDLSERGIKPGLTVVLEETQRRILQLLRSRSRKFSSSR